MYMRNGRVYGHMSPTAKTHTHLVHLVLVAVHSTVYLVNELLAMDGDCNYQSGVKHVHVLA